ncbi:uncharacterized protein METZ01_LOCUS112258, partial [marine metagenome]
ATVTACPLRVNSVVNRQMLVSIPPTSRLLVTKS